MRLSALVSAGFAKHVHVMIHLMSEMTYSSVDFHLKL